MSQQIRHQAQEQASQLPSYQRTPILNQRLDRIRPAAQEQITEGPVVFQSSMMQAQQAERGSAISQAQVSRVPSALQSSTSLLPRLEYNQATSQVQLTQPTSTFQASSSSTQRVDVNHGISSAQQMDNTHGSPYAQYVDNNRGQYAQRGDNIHGNSNNGNCNPVFPAVPCGPSAAACSPRTQTNCAPEASTSFCCSISKCLMGVMGLLSTLWVAIAVSQIVLGSVYLGTCPLQRYIPIYCIVSGSTLLAMILISGLGAIKPLRFLLSFVGILGLFWLAWLIAGSIWTFPHYHDYARCNRVIYLFTFSMLIIQWIMIALSLPALIAQIVSLISSCTSCSLCSCCGCSACSRCLSCLRCSSCCSGQGKY
ncbi:uncharacterized protein LOC144781726 [Lissotriton helveticus]